jgi:hypothetical protein
MKQIKVKKQSKSVTMPSAEERESMAAAKRGNKVVAILPDGKAPVESGQEAEASAIQNDGLRANDIAPQADVTPDKEVKIADELWLSPDSSAWNQGIDNTHNDQTLQNNVLTRFEYVPSQLTLPSGKKSKYQILTCSDNGIEVGRPFNPSTYTLLNNADFLGVGEQIANGLDKLGVKCKLVSSGTLMERDRQFYCFKLDGHEELKIDDKRTVRMFMNCLNSIPSSAGCTVTFANNGFVVCCRNTFAKALRKADDTEFHASLKHSKGLKPMLKDIPLMVESFISGNAKLLTQLKAFTSFPVTLDDAGLVFSAFIGKDKSRLPVTAKDIAELTVDKFLLLAGMNDKAELTTRSANMVERLKTLFTRGDGNKGESALDVFQAVTQYYTHESAGDSDDKLKQVQSSEIGSGAIAKADFFDMLIAATQSRSRWQGVAKIGQSILVAWDKTRQGREASKAASKAKG